MLKLDIQKRTSFYRSSGRCTFQWRQSRSIESLLYLAPPASPAASAGSAAARISPPLNLQSFEDAPFFWIYSAWKVLHSTFLANCFSGVECCMCLAFLLHIRSQFMISKVSRTPRKSKLTKDILQYLIQMVQQMIRVLQLIAGNSTVSNNSERPVDALAKKDEWLTHSQLEIKRC